MSPFDGIAAKVGEFFLILVFSDSAYIVSLSASGDYFIFREPEGFALVQYGWVFGVGSGVVAGVRFLWFEVRWVEEYFFSNIHIRE